MTLRIAIIAPSCTLDPAIPERLIALASDCYGAAAPELVFHPQCFETEGHFAGPDASRVAALVEVANDPAFDAVWCARGGYGACRVADTAIRQMGQVARTKLWMGYSDAGFLLAGLYARGIGRQAHGPMPADIKRDGGEAAIRRALDWFQNPEGAAHEPAPGGVGLSPPLTGKPAKTAAFNLTVLSQLLGTPLQPDLSDHVLMIEEVSEYMYRIDRTMFHITANPAIRAVSGIRLGRMSDIPENDPDFAMTAEEVVRFWCDKAGIAFLGSADIGHDAQNKVVPFG
jgi:muramoyltetrapeptide carboxypeptidase